MVPMVYLWDVYNMINDFFFGAYCHLIQTLEINNQSNRYVFITGCDTGFGYLLARTLDAKGVNVVAGCHTEKWAHDLKKVTSSRLRTVVVDVTDKESVKKAVMGSRKQCWHHTEFLTTVDDYKVDSEVNLFGTISVTLAFLPLLRKSRGRLVNVCSIFANWRYPGLSSYLLK
ncbi:dehydrogenase/reductase SDR family member 9-like [Mercenaria mercenaria]|uniref:dehydrogenase/reductase SDR family member 9-like n=1 Tax=Mercenaria mercenaria TaxID=6596 RepID=UPI00234F5300|nr:dehydrogenase/reductase SDR family member 9-like [Mercenaria mercenaria]